MDEDIIDWWRNQSITQCCDLIDRYDNQRGIGDKSIVRYSAKSIGLIHCCTLQKRAAQFGSRIANRKVKGQSLIDSHTCIIQFVNPKFLHPWRK